MISTDWTPAIIAASAAVLVAVLTYTGAGENVRRAAVRSLINEDIQELGNLIYRIVAISKKTVRAKSSESREKWRKESYECRNKLNELRGRVRYSLWGIDDGLRALRSSTFYAEHYIDDKINADRMLKRSTNLRIALDKAIVDAFHMGRPPRFWQIWSIQFCAWRLNRCFSESERGVNDDGQV